MAKNIPNLMKDINLHILEIPTNSKQDKFKEIHTKTPYNHPVKSQTQRVLKAVRQKKLVIYKRASIREHPELLNEINS